MSAASAVHFTLEKDPRVILNAGLNGYIVADARTPEEYVTSHVQSALLVAASPDVWDPPDEPSHAVVYGESADDKLRFVIAKLQTRFPRLRSVCVCTAPFAAFEAAFPFAVERGSEEGGYLPLLPHSITDGVWLGSALHAEDPALLAMLGIGAVVCMMDDRGGMDPATAVSGYGSGSSSAAASAAAPGSAEAAAAPASDAGITLLRFPWIDDESHPILQDLPAVVAAIEAGRRRRRGVLVHCYYGKSRSAAAVAAWLMGHAGLTAEQAHAYLRAQRATVQINPGFLADLHKWEGMLRRGGSSGASS